METLFQEETNTILAYCKSNKSLKEIATCIKKYGIEPSLEAMYGEELKENGIDLTDDSNLIFHKLETAMEDGNETIWEKIKAFFAKIVAWIKNFLGLNEKKEEEAKAAVDAFAKVEPIIAAVENAGPPESNTVVQKKEDELAHAVDTKPTVAPNDTKPHESSIAILEEQIRLAKKVVEGLNKATGIVDFAVLEKCHNAIHAIVKELSDANDILKRFISNPKAMSVDDLHKQVCEDKVYETTEGKLSIVDAIKFNTSGVSKLLDMKKEQSLKEAGYSKPNLRKLYESTDVCRRNYNHVGKDTSDLITKVQALVGTNMELSSPKLMSTVSAMAQCSSSVSGAIDACTNTRKHIDGLIGIDKKK